MIQLGAGYGEAPINLFSLLLQEKQIIGSVRYDPGDFPEAIDLLAKEDLNVEPLITARIPLEEAVSKGFEALLRPEEGHVKILITPNYRLQEKDFGLRYRSEFLVRRTGKYASADSFLWPCQNVFLEVYRTLG